ncbi:MAG: acyl-CoA dehydrogenase family protein [Bdellovibrionales bacterium]|nr:acyl-CoA dehydrogenase family protein [Bdellovibrionales bacterium]
MALVFYPETGGEEKRIRDRVRAIAEQHLRPYALEDDSKCRFRREAFEAFAREGLASVVTPKAYGGLELPYACYYTAMSEIARASMSMAVTVGVNNLPQGALLAYGTEEQKKKYITPLCNGEAIGAFSLSEPGSGSDAAGLRTQAVKKGDGYVLNGTKCWCSTAGYADLYLVMARTAEDKTGGISAFIVEKDISGLRFGKQESKLGLKASPLGELIFEDCFVPLSQRVGLEGQGLGVALSQLDSGRIVIAAVGIGLAEEALNRLWKAFADHTPGATDKNLFAEFYARLQALKSLLQVAASAKDNNGPVTTVAAQLKLLASDLAMEVTSHAVSAMGPRGTLVQNEMERLFRDAKALQIVEGTNQIQKLVLVREMDKAFKK